MLRYNIDQNTYTVLVSHHNRKSAIPGFSMTHFAKSRSTSKNPIQKCYETSYHVTNCIYHKKRPLLACIHFLSAKDKKEGEDDHRGRVTDKERRIITGALRSPRSYSLTPPTAL